MTDFIFLCSKITVHSDCSHKIKRFFLLRKAMANPESILKSRDITLLTKVHIVKAVVFFSSLIQVWELVHKEIWVPKKLWFWITVLEKTLESPLDCKEIKPFSLTGNQSWIFIGRQMLELKLRHFGHLMRKTDSLEKTLMLGKIEGRRRRGRQRMSWLDGITDSMDMSLSKLQSW